MELRKDYFLNRWVVISEDRGRRPNQFGDNKQEHSDSCVFCLGNEDKTPKEIYRIEGDGKWSLRVIPNKFSAVDPTGNPEVTTHNQFYTFAGDHGKHEVVIETPDHSKNYGDLSVEEIKNAIMTYSYRINELQKDLAVRYVSVFKNQGKEAGASIAHAHTQIISFAMIPPVVVDKIESMLKYPKCPYCQVIQREKDSLRRCIENDSFIAITPYASRFNYEVWVLAKEHIKCFDDFSDKTYLDLAHILKNLCMKVEEMGVSYNVEWYYAPGSDDLHFHVEIIPRIALWAGFEMGYGVTINTVSPEQAAKFYRGEE
jgi:UDPglucose--hexose-1-phosphate uridylyltransferase